jgi:hypothetical protein
MLLFKPTNEEIEKAAKYNSVVKLVDRSVLSHFLIEYQATESRFEVKYMYTPNWIEYHKESNVKVKQDDRGEYVVLSTYAQLHTGEIALIELPYRK